MWGASGGNRNPVNADSGGSHGRGWLDDITAQARLDLANAQPNGSPPTAWDDDPLRRELIRVDRAGRSPG
jgi:hypothetical protein